MTLPAAPSINGVPFTRPGLSGQALVKLLVDGCGEQYLALADLRTALVPCVDVISQTIAATDFTDGGGASGTKTMTASIPAGSLLLGSKVVVTAGFAGDTSAVLTIGDGSDVDRHNTGAPSIFATAANGVDVGLPSGSKLVTAAHSPVLTVTSDADFTLAKNGGGSLDVSVFYLRTA